jgi:MscS family membrane protein
MLVNTRYGIHLRFAALTLILALSFSLWAQEGELAEAVTVDLSSPRAMVRTFFEAMSAVESGNDERLTEAVACLYFGEDVAESDRLTQGAVVAQVFFEVMNRHQFSMDEIPESWEERDYTLDMGEDEGAYSFPFHRHDDGLWRFQSSVTEDEGFEAIQKQLAEEKAEEQESAQEQGIMFDPRFESPRATMQTFIRGMNETDGLTKEDAYAALDLSDTDEALRAELAEKLAYQLKTVIDRIERVEYSELPPDSDGPLHRFHTDPNGLGSIVIDVVDTDEEGGRAWKFTRKSLDTLEKLYSAYRTKALAKGVQARQDKKPLYLHVRDWSEENAPFLLNKTVFLENLQWLGLFLVVMTGMLVSRLAGMLLIHLIKSRLARKRLLEGLDLESGFAQPIRIAIMAWFWLLGFTWLGLPENARYYLRTAAIMVTAISVLWALYRLIDIIGRVLTDRAKRTKNKFDDLLIPILLRSMKIFLLVIAIVVMAETVFKDATSLITGLGLGGLAFALAAKDVVANVFGSFTILLDRPFQLGDWVTMGDVDGNVEMVGIRSTRIRTFYNSLITVPNSQLINASVDNMGARRYRRIKTTLGISYDTPPEKIEAFCEGIRELIRTHPYTRKDYYHCYLNQFEASSLSILLYCFVETPEWGTELRERHRMFIDIMRLAQRLGVEFAFPTQTLFMREDHPREAVPPVSMDESLHQGRAEARGIVRETVGPPGTIPPPVDYLRSELQHGEDDEDADGEE